MFSISCSFWEYFAKPYFWRWSRWRLGGPTLRRILNPLRNDDAGKPLESIALIEAVMYCAGNCVWLLPPATKLGQGYIFTGVCDSVHRVGWGGGGISACIAGGIPACLGAGLRGWYPNMPCRFPGPHPGGKFRGIWPRGSPGPYPGGLLPGGGVVCSRGVCLLLGGSTPGVVVCSGGVPGPGGCGDPPDGYCCGRYASYWNAFLCQDVMIHWDVWLHPATSLLPYTAECAAVGL